MMVPEFLGVLKKAGVLGKSFLLSAHRHSCLTWQIEDKASLRSPNLYLKAKTFEEGSDMDKSDSGGEGWN